MSDEPVETGALFWEAASAQATGAWAQKRRLAAAMRRVIDQLLQIDAPEDDLSRAADGLERYARTLEQYPRGQRYAGFAETSAAGDVQGFFDQSPVIGLSNPLSPPVTLRPDPDGRRIHGEVTFGVAYEGPPGHVHGGWLACAFDELLGYTQSLSQEPGMTGSLTVRYRRPTPLHTALRFEAELERVEGRKIFTRGWLYAGDRLTAEAEGLFISVPRERFETMRAERDPG